MEYSSSLCVFHKKKASKEIETIEKTGFLIEKSVYLVFILVLLPRMSRLDCSWMGTLPPCPLNIR